MAGHGTESNMENPRLEWHANGSCCLLDLSDTDRKNHVAKCVYHQITQLNLFQHKCVCLVTIFEAFQIHGRPWDRIQHGKTKGGIAWSYCLLDVSGSKKSCGKVCLSSNHPIKLVPTQIYMFSAHV